MAEVVPTITPSSVSEFTQQLNRAKFAPRLHLDFMDGKFTPSRSINLIEAHWTDDLIIDLHLMFVDPTSQLETAISMKPHLIILHAESQGKIGDLLKQFKEVGIRGGVALLQQTKVAEVGELIKAADHVLIFTGKLGSYGGDFQGEHLSKVADIRAVNPNVEIAVDGGVNDGNAAKIIEAGADILNVGSYLQQADNPKLAYQKLQTIAVEAAK